MGSRSSESMNRALTKKRLEPDDFDTESSGSRGAFRPAENEAEPALLTSRELEILAAIGEGLTNKEVARRLGISPHTVKFHLEAIFEKLGAGSRAEAIAKGLRQHLIEL